MEWLRDFLRRSSYTPRGYRKSVFWTFEYVMIVPFAHLYIFLSFIHLIMLLTFQTGGINIVPTEGSSPPNPSSSENYPHPNMHPLFMSLGLLFLSGNAILLFRSCCCFSRRVVKYIHAGTQLIVIPLMFYGWYMIWGFHSLEAHSPYNARSFSFHSWAGFAVMAFFLIQFITGFIAFLVLPYLNPIGSAEFRARWAGYHKFIGITIFFMVISQCMTGIVGYQMYWDLPYGHTTAGCVDPDSCQAYDACVYRARSMKIAVAMYTLTFITVLYTLLKDDFRHRGRIILADDVVVVKGIHGI